MTLQPESSEGVTPLGRRGTGSYLSPDQFMSMRRVKNLAALDSGTGGPVGDLIPDKQHEVEYGIGDTADYPALTDQMRADGPKGTEVPPILVNRGSSTSYPAEGTLGNGGHRVAIAHDLGWKAMRYTRDPDESGWGDDRFDRNDDDDAETPMGYRRTSGGGITSESEYRPASSAHDPRSHVPGHTGITKNSRVNQPYLWHGGEHSQQGLYTQLHPPAEAPLQPQQFARTMMGQDQREGYAQHVAFQGRENKQLKFPGMPVHFAGGGPTDMSEYNARMAGGL